MFTTKGITVFSESLEMLRHVQYGNTLLIWQSKLILKIMFFFSFTLSKGFWNEMSHSNIVLNLWMYHELTRKAKRPITSKFRKIQVFCDFFGYHTGLVLFQTDFNFDVNHISICSHKIFYSVSIIGWNNFRREHR